MTIDEPLMDASSSIPAAVLRGRVARLQEWARQQNLHALVVFGQGSALGNATRSHGNLRFLMDWDADAAASAVIIPVNGSPSLVVANIFAAMRATKIQCSLRSASRKGRHLHAPLLICCPKAHHPRSPSLVGGNSRRHLGRPCRGRSQQLGELRVRVEPTTSDKR